MTVALWVVGPVAGRLIATEVSSHTLRHLHPWQDQFHIASIVSWTTAFTETVEQRNPALVATGMSTSEWCGRIVAGLVLVMLTFVVTSSGPIFDYGPTLAAIRTSYPAQVATLQAIDSSTLTALPSPGRSPSTVNSAVSQLERSFGLGAPGALVCLAVLSKVPKADLAYLGAHGAAVATARRQSRSQWSEWWWLTFGSELLFVPTLLALTGRWAPRSARADIEAHKKMIEPEIRAVEGLS